MINITQDDIELDWYYENSNHDYLLSLLRTSTFEERLIEYLEMDINDIEGMTIEKYEKISFNLFSNQLDRITAGLPYSQTDILHHLRKLK